MNITIRLTKVEYEMLKELQRRDKRYKKGLEEKVKNVFSCTLRNRSSDYFSECFRGIIAGIRAVDISAVCISAGVRGFLCKICICIVTSKYYLNDIWIWMLYSWFVFLAAA